MSIIVFIISFGASVIGAICGMGGGVIIKPLLDLFSVTDVAAISFLSGCTVLSMSGYNVLRSFTSEKGRIETRTVTPLAIGAMFGGLAGSRIFQILRPADGNDGPAGTAQSLIMLILVAGTLLYTLKKGKIHPLYVKSRAVCALIGLVMGTLSAFLGIGGGPFYLVILHFFLGQEAKKAAVNSLYIILISQAASILMKIACGAVPQFPISSLLLMITGGITGSMAGRVISKHMKNRSVDKLFAGLMAVILIVCLYNTFLYLKMVF